MSRQDYQTPDYVLLAIKEGIMDIKFDATCTTKNCVAYNGFYFDKGKDALKNNWLTDGTFCNPPWNRAKDFVEYVSIQHTLYRTEIVMVLPASVNTKYFHKHIFGKTDIYFPNCRIAYIDPDDPNKKSPMHESMIVHFYSSFIEDYQVKSLDLISYKKGED